MLSPFPGMDPYLESQTYWPDFHASFILYCRDALADSLPDNYEVRIDERINFVELRPEQHKRFAPDLTIAQRGPSTSASSAPSEVATVEPVTIPLPIEESYRETYLEILHRPDRTLVAVLELLSPANKEERGRSVYLNKRNALLLQAVHLVELDLLLGGQRLPLEGDYPSGHYYALIARWTRRPNCDVYAWTIRQPLPRIPIPLKDPDPDVWLDLAALFATAYQRGRYARSLDYSQPPPPALREEERSWVVERLQARQREG